MIFFWKIQLCRTADFFTGLDYSSYHSFTSYPVPSSAASALQMLVTSFSPNCDAGTVAVTRFQVKGLRPREGKFLA